MSATSQSTAANRVPPPLTIPNTAAPTIATVAQDNRVSAMGHAALRVSSPAVLPSALQNHSALIQKHGLAPWIEKHLHLQFASLDENGKAYALERLFAIAIQMNEVEKLQPPTAETIHSFFEEVEARNLIRVMSAVHKVRPLPHDANLLRSLEIASDRQTTLARACMLRIWIGKHQQVLTQYKKLDLGSCGLTFLPKEIGKFNGLEILILGGNRLITLPKEIGLLAGLQTLELTQNHIDQLPNEIGALQKLQKLFLNQNRLIQVPKGICELRALRELDLGNNALTALPKEFGKLKALRELWLSDNNFVEFPIVLTHLHGLKRLWLVANKIAVLPKEIGALKNLEQLGIWNNCLTKLCKEIGKLHALEQLLLGWNRLVSLPAEIGQLKHLKELDVRENQLTDLPKEIGQLKALCKLLAFANRLTGLPKEIGNLKGLKELYLGGNQLIVLPKEIGQLAALCKLDLDQNALTSLPKEIGQLKALIALSARVNKIDSLPREIGGLKSLETFWLQGNLLVILPKELAQLNNLYLLDLNNNPNVVVPQEIMQTQRSLYILVSSDIPLAALPKGIFKEPTLENTYCTKDPSIASTQKPIEPRTEPQNKERLLQDLLDQLTSCLKEKKDPALVSQLLQAIETNLGKELRSQLHRCLYDICQRAWKNDKKLVAKLKEDGFARKAFLDPKFDRKLKLAAIELFRKTQKKLEK